MNIRPGTLGLALSSLHTSAIRQLSIHSSNYLSLITPMNVLVILCGIADPKWPLPLPLTASALREQRASYPLLSPFDEAALELALKLRDADPLTRISVLLAASSAQDKLMQHVASFRIDQLIAYPADLHPAWDSAALAKAFAAQVMGSDTVADLVLIGREFGDEDDASVPAAIAQALNWPFVSQTMEVRQGEGAVLQLTRQFGPDQELLSQAAPLVAAVTNHSRNKLRHPLLKNVMMTKKMVFTLTPLPTTDHAALVRLEGLALATPPVSAAQCRMLAGDVATQARALAQLLLTTGDNE